MDIREQVAARRAELEKEENARNAAQKAAKEAVESEALKGFAERLDGETVHVFAQDGELHMQDKASETFDVVGFNSFKLTRLLAIQARRRFSPNENFITIGLMVSGFIFLFIGGFGAILVLLSIYLEHKYNNKYVNQLKSEYPEIFQNAMSPYDPKFKFGIFRNMLENYKK